MFTCQAAGLGGGGMIGSGASLRFHGRVWTIGVSAMNEHAAPVALLAGLLSMLALWGAHRENRRRRLMAALPTGKALGVFIGLVELKGTAESDQPLTGWLSGDLCVWYEYTVEEHWRRVVTESYTDAKGNLQTRTRVESGWRTVAEGGRAQAFELRDETGGIRVWPEGAEVVPETVFSATCDPSAALYYAKGPAGAIAHSTHERRFTERAVPLHHPLYLIGQARERTDRVASEIAASEAAPLFLISTRDEEREIAGAGWASWGWALAGLLFATVPAWFDAAFDHGEFLPELCAALAAGYLVIWGLTWLWSVFNALVDVRHRVAAAASLVDIQLQRRATLIPQLCAVVTGFRAHESAVQTAVARLRAEAAATAPGSPGPDPAGVGATVVALAEAYPELKADALFGRLGRELVDTEDRLALARRYYNDLASHANLLAERFPDNLVAPLAGIRVRPLLVAEGYARDAVPVRFTSEPAAGA